MMRDTVLCLCEDASEEAIKASVEKMVQSVQEYVPGYHLKQDVQVERVTREHQLVMPETGEPFVGLKVSVFVEVEGAAHYLPAYAGNLDIMTSAALRTAERLAENHNLTK